MKLKNKQTGEIVDTLCRDDITKGLAFGVDHHDGNPTMAYYNSLAELNAEWEDYEEPKEYWYIDCYGTVIRSLDNGSEWDERRKEIGNYFKTKEEAEKAVEKLKVWTRLTDKGFRFSNGIEVFSEGLLEIASVLPALKGADNAERSDIIDSLYLLFGGEE